MLRPGGFPEYSPGEQIIFDQIKEIIEKNYQQFGYAHIHTPAVEANHVLLAKSGEDASKQIFGLYGLAQGAEDTKEYALHFDLTIPFARYVLDRENELTFPFKRYQIQPVRRGERSQRGRFKEFWQSDIDVIRQETEKNAFGKNLYYDAEMLIVIARTLDQIIEKFLNKRKFTLHVNNRYLLAGFFSQFSEEVLPRLYSLFDKYYKISQETFETELVNILGSEDAKKTLEFVKTGDFRLLKRDLVDSDTYRRGYIEMEEVLNYVNFLNSTGDKKYNIVYDPFIIRGLDYYTGTVYETLFDDDIALGSISSGGRYENLTGYINPKKNNFSGVGGSIGLSRLVYLILEKIESKNKTRTHYLFINFKETITDICNLMNKYRDNEEYIELYPSAEKLGKQFGYADKKGIPYVILLGEGEKNAGSYKIKNMQSGEETMHKL